MGVPCTTYPLENLAGAIFSKGCHKEFGCWGPQLHFFFWGDSVVLWKGNFLFWGDSVVLWKGKPFSLQASLAPVLKNFSQLTPLKQISLLASWVFPVLPTPLKIWQGATFSKGCHKEFGCWGPQLNFLFRDFNHHLLVGGAGRLGGAGGAERERERSCTELGINYQTFFFGNMFPDFLPLTKTVVY